MTILFSTPNSQLLRGADWINLEDTLPELSALALEVARRIMYSPEMVLVGFIMNPKLTTNGHCIGVRNYKGNLEVACINARRKVHPMLNSDLFKNMFDLLRLIQEATGTKAITMLPYNRLWNQHICKDYASDACIYYNGGRGARGNKKITPRAS